MKNDYWFFCDKCGVIRSYKHGEPLGAYYYCCGESHLVSGALTEEHARRLQAAWLNSKMGERPSGRYEKILTLKKYLLLKVEQGDWHAVSDAANDIRVLEGK